MVTAAINVDTVAAALATARPRHWNNEAQLHECLIGELSNSGFDVAHEVHVPSAGRIDLAVGTIGIEVKVSGTVTAVIRQLHKYASTGQFTGLVLVTTRSAHRAIPEQIASVPTRVIWLSAAL